MDIEFQSTHPRGVRLLLNSNKCLSLCFNPRTHVGCDKNRVYATDIKDVSIHAPTWGATPCKRRPPVRYWFQSTHPRGVRHRRLVLPFYNRYVSIHAPTWGATWCAFLNIFMLCFNPRTHVGCDASVEYVKIVRLVFQSTHPRGVRPYEQASKYDDAMFQSTHPRGVRQMYMGQRVMSGMFQSTHPRGVRLIFSKYLNIILQKYINCEQHANF